MEEYSGPREGRKTKVMNNLNKSAAEGGRARHVRQSHAAGRRREAPGARGARPPFPQRAPPRPPHAPSPLRSAATRGHPRPSSSSRTGLGAARQFPPREPSLFPSARARRALCLPAGRACAAAAILRCLSPALPFGELSPPPRSPAQRPPPPQRSARRRGRAGRDPRRPGSRESPRERRKEGKGRPGVAEEERYRLL